MSALTAQGLSFTYGRYRVLDGVTLSVPRASVLGVVGPNGAGKSTLLRCLAGILHGQGVVAYGGVAVTQESARARARRRSYVPQQTGLAFPYTVSEVIAMGLAHESRFFNPPASAASVAEIARAVGFTGSLSHRYDRLSGGEQQQVLVARALVGRADILLFDEPTSSLDLRHRALVMAAVEARRRAGATVVLAMHDLSLAALACDRLLLLSAGRAVSEGAPAEVLRPDVLREVYGVSVVCGVHTITGTPTVDLDPSAWR
ncbi:MAG: ABC transporter ATP-binding protein [Deltaproteobacteria bacterium]|nr:ABC transporter ATP-binding protein [Deltaproteobacteria bacterium]